MAEIEHQSIVWSIDIDLDNNLEEISEAGRDCCIYKVPQYLRKINEEAYTPCFISIGPLHYGRKKLMGMERQKRRYRLKFGERVDNEQKLREFKTYVENEEQRIRAHYSVISKLQSSEYVEMILNDAVFIIELFKRNDTGPNDFFLNYSTSLSLDLLLLENQIPCFVLNHLYSSVFPSSEGHHPSFFALCLKFFKDHVGIFNWSFSEQPQLKHFTDFMRYAIVGQVQLEIQPNDSDETVSELPCATKLKKSGLLFKGIDDQSICLHQISLVKKECGKSFPWFGVNELQIPRILISDETEKIFRNLMALEIFYYPTKTYICHYADLMDHLIDTATDVDLLVENGVIVNWVGDIEQIAKMFNKLNSHIAIGILLIMKTSRK